jgi:hypothetical protein
MPDLATEAPITDEELADAIRVRGRQVRNGIKVLQLILDHIPPETRRVPWNGQQDFYRNIPQTMRHRFLGSVEVHRELMTAAARWIIAWKLRSVLSARMAIRLNSLSLQKKFSIRWRHLYISVSIRSGVVRRGC